MLAVSFFDIFFLFMKDATIRQPELFGLEDFSPSELTAKEYELVGEVADFHFYEKEYSVIHHGRPLSIVFKRYFCQENQVGSGFSVGPGARLISLLKQYKYFAGQNGIAKSNPDFYFSDDKKEGAAIFDGSIVVRFNQWGNKSGYAVATIESDFDEAGAFKGMATDPVKKTMELYNMDSICSEPEKRSKSSAFRRLVKFLSK